MTGLAILRWLGAVPRGVWAGLAATLLLLGIVRWHQGKVAAAFTKGVQQQAAADRGAIETATAAAEAAQAARIAALTAQQSRISKGTDDALAETRADLARRGDNLRLRWAAARAVGGGPGASATIALPAAAAGPLDTACPAAGWVAFDTAAAAAAAADEALAKDDAWIAWAAAQAAAWPQDQP
ncbi:hypothetical protein IP88_09560 [alpha proteobacterium AAP81b]|nr:hypothetical protein IP88_09560 [alpha proteobacterium AAP81b]